MLKIMEKGENSYAKGSLDSIRVGAAGNSDFIYLFYLYRQVLSHGFF
jgi:hypothetical protein